MSLLDYKKKRNFAKTAEPRGNGTRSKRSHRFVIQKHAASRLHYDFRLEMGGTLKSWAVPKGIPYAKGEKHLAVHVEDHPIAYIDFEGTIPKGEYGGGTVMVWDRGTWESAESSSKNDIGAGKLHFSLNGKKLRGEWRLVQMRGSDQWLLIRGGEDMSPVSAKQDDTSALSGKSMSQLSRNGSEYVPRRDKKKRARTLGKSAPESHSRKPGASLHFLEPMKAKLVEAPPKGDWIYEVKFDGYRALALKDADGVRLLSRNEKDFADKFPDIVNAVSRLKVKEAMLDGEVVALDKKGRSSFQLLQSMDIGEEPPLYYYVFDLLHLDGESLLRLPLLERKARLGKLLKNAPDAIRLSASLAGNVPTLVRKISALGLEGLIGKRADSIYEPGRRSGAWVKYKLRQEQEFVIGGYTNPAGTRKYFGALLAGYYERGKLKFAGKIGTGFDSALLASLHQKLTKIAREECPFVNLPEKSGGRGMPITASRMKLCHWVKPTLVGQVAFSEWTRDGKLRQPAFLGLREDKAAREVVREKPSIS